MISIQTATFFFKKCSFLGEIHYFCTLVMMNWQQLISNKRLGQEHRHPERHDDRTEFKRDYDRLIFSAPFRRLQNKTQVFPLPGSIFVHNRLTHSLEVASVGMSLGNDVALHNSSQDHNHNLLESPKLKLLPRKRINLTSRVVSLAKQRSAFPWYFLLELLVY